MSSQVQAHATSSAPQPKMQRVEEPTPQVNPTPQVKLFEIEDNDLEQENKPINFLCPISGPIIYVT